MIYLDHNQHQKVFDQLKAADDWCNAIDWFVQKQIDEGFVDPDELQMNTLFSQFSARYDLDFKILINRVRDAYAKQVVDSDNTSKKKYCPLCVENIDAIGQHKKQVVYLSLNQREYVLSLTPFPSFSKHLVLSLKTHKPMFMQAETIVDLLELQKQVGDRYSIVCNSDHAKTGASILEHHHVQLLNETRFPVAGAKAKASKTVMHDSGHVLVELLDFPATVMRLSADSIEHLKVESQAFLAYWRSLDSEDTCNLWLRKKAECFEIYFILRHPSYETDPSLFRYKTEGIGIIEMCGFGIFPTPKVDTDIILQEIEVSTVDIMVRLLASHAPDFPMAYFK